MKRIILSNNKRTQMIDCPKEAIVDGKIKLSKVREALAAQGIYPVGISVFED